MLSYALAALLAVIGSTEPSQMKSSQEESENEIVFEEWEASEADELALEDSILNSADSEEESDAQE